MDCYSAIKMSFRSHRLFCSHDKSHLTYSSTILSDLWHSPLLDGTIQCFLIQRSPTIFPLLPHSCFYRIQSSKGHSYPDFSLDKLQHIPLSVKNHLKDADWLENSVIHPPQHVRGFSRALLAKKVRKIK
jgi:hypothetical protein